MPRKSATEPRRLYNRNGSTFVLFCGRYYAAPSASEIALVGSPVKCVPMPSDGGRARIEAQVGDKKEVWRSHRLEVKHRAPKAESTVALAAAKAPNK